MASPSYPVSGIGTLFSPISNCAPILRLRFLSTPRFHTICDQAPGSTAFLSFVSDATAFPSPPLLRDCSFDPVLPSAEGITEQWRISSGHMSAAPRNARRTLLLPVPRDCSQVPALPTKIHETV